MLFTDLTLDYLLQTYLKLYSLYKPYPPLNWTRGDKQDIIMIPGWRGAWTFLKHIGNHLNQTGYKIHYVQTLQDGTLSITDSAQHLRDYILQNRLEDIILIGHSRGGLIIRKLLGDREMESKVYKVFTIASPHQGSLTGHIRHTHIYEILPSSDFMKKLPKNTHYHNKIVNIYPRLDTHIIPNTSLLLEGAINEKIEINGHTRILSSVKTLEILDKYLA